MANQRSNHLFPSTAAVVASSSNSKLLNNDFSYEDIHYHSTSHSVTDDLSTTTTTAIDDTVKLDEIIENHERDLVESYGCNLEAINIGVLKNQVK